MKTTKKMMTGGIGLGVGQEVLSGSNTAYAQQGVGKVSASFPKVGLITAGGMVMDSLNKFKKKTMRLLK